MESSAGEAGQKQSFKTMDCRGRRLFTIQIQLRQAAQALHSALQYANLWRSILIAVIYLGTSAMSFDLLCATVTQLANQLRTGASLEARCCLQSKISQGIKSKAQSDNLHNAAQAQLPSARDSNYCFTQQLCMDIREAGHKIPLLQTRMVYLQNPQRVTCGRSVCQDPLPPLGFSPVLFASRWADRVLVGSPHQGCRNSVARTWLT